MPAPIGQTCPIIDDVIYEIKKAYTLIEEALNDQEHITPVAFKDKLNEALDVLSGTHGKHSNIEEVRDANWKLRNWGAEMEDKADSLEADNDDLKDEIKRLQSEMRDLESAYKDAQSELSQRY